MFAAGTGTADVDDVQPGGRRRRFDVLGLLLALLGVLVALAAAPIKS